MGTFPILVVNLHQFRVLLLLLLPLLPHKITHSDLLWAEAWLTGHHLVLTVFFPCVNNESFFFSSVLCCVIGAYVGDNCLICSRRWKNQPFQNFKLECNSEIVSKYARIACNNPLKSDFTNLESQPLMLMTKKKKGLLSVCSTCLLYKHRKRHFCKWARNSLSRR